MAHERRTPTALNDPKVSIVIPVYNEKDTICEILRRVVDTDIRKEIVVVEDCSKDGTQQILEGLAKIQADGRSEAPAPDGETRCHLSICGSFFRNTTRARVRHCGSDLLRQPGILSWYRMLTWNMTPRLFQIA